MLKYIIYICRIYSFLYVFDIDVTRNGNNLKLKVKSEFSLSMGLMLINHSNPYIHSTTVLCDIVVRYNSPVLQLITVRLDRLDTRVTQLIDERSKSPHSYSRQWKFGI